MTAISLRSRHLNNAGGGLNALTVEVYATDATGLPTGAAVTSTTTDVNGVWQVLAAIGLLHSTRYAVKIINGTEVQWLDSADMAQLEELAVRTKLILPNGSVVDSTGIPAAALASDARPGCSVAHSAAQSIAHATLTAIAFDTTIYDDDPGVMHSDAVNNSRVTIKTAGKYTIIANAIFAANATGRRQLNLIVNGTIYIEAEDRIALTSVPTTLSISREYELSVNDYIEAKVYQASGGALNIEASPGYSPVMTVRRTG